MPSAGGARGAALVSTVPSRRQDMQHMRGSWAAIKLHKQSNNQPRGGVRAGVRALLS